MRKVTEKERPDEIKPGYMGVNDLGCLFSFAGALGVFWAMVFVTAAPPNSPEFEQMATWFALGGIVLLIGGIAMDGLP